MATLSLPKDKAGRQKLLLAIVPLLIFFGYYQLMHGKKQEEIAGLESRLDEIETKNRGAKAIALSGGPELQQKLAIYEQHMIALEQLIPKSEEVATLLNGLAERAMDTNVDLSLMKPETTEQGEFYTEQTYQIQVIGLYHDIGRYLASVASGPRIVTPVKLRIRPRPAAEKTRDGMPRLNAEFRIVTYVIPPAPEPGTQQTPPQGGASGSN
jgi:type IV pilus assembly protein PilO